MAQVRALVGLPWRQFDGQYRHASNLKLGQGKSQVYADIGVTREYLGRVQIHG
jgi:hypothetical protein